MSISDRIGMTSVLWGQDSLEVIDLALADALCREADAEHATDSHLLEAVRGRWDAWTEAVHGDEQATDKPGFPQLAQPPLTSRLFRGLLGLALPAALNLHPTAKPERIVALRVRLDRISPHTLVWCLDGYRIYADHRINGSVVGRCVGDWSAILVRGLDAQWRALSYDRIAPVEEGHPKARRHFRLENGGLYNQDGDLLREVLL